MAAYDQMQRTSLYVGDLHPQVTENDLYYTFSRAGPLLSLHLCRHHLTAKSLCYAYVNFWLPCHAYTALKCLNHTLLRGKPMRIMWYDKNSIARIYGIGNLYVNNLDQSITSAGLESTFSKYGTILSCKVMERNGISRGFGYVQFDSEDSAMKALNALHDTHLQGKKIYVAKYRNKIERKANIHHGLGLRNLKRDEYSNACYYFESNNSNLDPHYNKPYEHFSMLPHYTPVNQQPCYTFPPGVCAPILWSNACSSSNNLIQAPNFRGNVSALPTRVARLKTLKITNGNEQGFCKDYGPLKTFNVRPSQEICNVKPSYKPKTLLQTPQDQSPSTKSQGKLDNGDGKELCDSSDTTETQCTESYPDIDKNLQTGNADNVPTSLGEQ